MTITQKLNRKQLVVVISTCIACFSEAQTGNTEAVEFIRQHLIDSEYNNCYDAEIANDVILTLVFS